MVLEEMHMRWTGGTDIGNGQTEALELQDVVEALVLWDLKAQLKEKYLYIFQFREGVQQFLLDTKEKSAVIVKPIDSVPCGVLEDSLQREDGLHICHHLACFHNHL